MKSFKDYFSKQAGHYQNYRPSYPDDMFTWLASLTPNHELAWDCGTGNGQAAVGLTPYYKKIYATDPSEEQVKHAVTHQQITYRVEKAEETALAAVSVDIITVSQALHWFDFDSFYTEVNRVLKPDGVLAAWTYGIPKISEKVNKVIAYFHDTVLDGYWKPGNQLVAEKYQTIPFPFEEIKTPAFSIQKELTLEDLIGLLNSWSAVQRYQNKNGQNPIDKIKADVTTAWQEGDNTKASEWEITMRVGR
tara:strand:+ start:4045 stop:4788 length:744 start_codon:yes stop_codon:yes gene_type:complete